MIRSKNARKTCDQKPKQRKAQVSKNKNDIKVNAQVSKDENSMKCKMLKVNGTYSMKIKA